MHRILRIHELVDEILSTLPSADLCSTIRANKFFFRASKPFLWRVISLNNALKLLGPTYFPPHCDQYRLQDRPTHEAWKRFFKYAQHVRKLTGSGSDVLGLWDAVRSLPGQESCETLGADNLDYLFPNCRTLEWLGTDELGDVKIDKLISPKLEFILLEGWDVIRIESQWFLDLSTTLTTRLSNLQVFHLDIGRFLDPDVPSPNLDPYLKLLTTFSQTLTSVALPGALATDTIFKKLSQIQNLSSLQVFYGNAFTSSENDSSDDSDLPEILPSLKHFTFDALIQPTAAFSLFCKLSLSSLRTLRWRMLNVPHNLCDFFAAIASKCPELEFLMLEETYNVARLPVFPWADIRPILGCSKLSYLELHCCRVRMTLDNYTELVRSRKEPTVWRVLQVFTSDTFHFPQILSLFAEYSPGIQALGLNVYVNQDIGPFEFIQPLRLPLYHLPLVSNLWRYLQLETQPRQGESIQQSGRLLPFLTLINFSASRFVSASIEFAAPIAALLLALCINPVYVRGMELRSISQIYERTANYFMNLEARTDEPMSLAAEEYVDFYQNKFEDWDFNPMDIPCLFYNLYDYANIQFPG